MPEFTAENILVSLVITWGIGLLPPILIRYVFLKRYVAKSSAIWICAAFAVFNVTLFTSMGSRTHTALVLVAWVSYWILRRGSKTQSDVDRLVRTAERIEENSDNRGSLTGAAWNGDWSTVKRLLAEGADVHQTNANGQTALDLARARGDKQIISLLLSCGATEHRPSSPTK